MDMEKIAIIGAILVGAYFLLDKLGQFSEGIGEAFSGLTTGIGEAFSSVTGGIGEFGGDVATGIGEFAGDVATGLGDVTEQSLDILETVAETPGDIAGGVGEFAGDVVTGIGEFFNNLIGGNGNGATPPIVPTLLPAVPSPSPGIGAPGNIYEPAWEQGTDIISDPGHPSTGGWGGR